MPDNCPRCGVATEKKAELSALGQTEIVTICVDCGWEVERIPLSQPSMTA